MKLAASLPWALLALVVSYPLFAQGQNPRGIFRAALMESVPIDARVPGQPRAQDIIQLVEGIPFTVPPGRSLVITALGSQFSTGHMVSISINGIMLVRREAIDQNAQRTVPTLTVNQLPHPGVAAHPGDVVEVWFGHGNPDDARAWGYLEDVR